MDDDEEQPSVECEPEVLSDGGAEFLGVVAFGLIVAIVTGGLCVAATVVICVFRMYGYL
jgi:hypothetical protein